MVIADFEDQAVSIAQLICDQHIDLRRMARMLTASRAAGFPARSFVGHLRLKVSMDVLSSALELL